MRRVAVIVASCGVVLCVVLAAAHYIWGESATLQGRRSFEHWTLVEKLLSATPPPGERSVIFMGDSTMIDMPSWSNLTGFGLRRHGLIPFHATFFGQDLFHYYCMSGRLLEWNPDLIVILVNVRVLDAKRRDGLAMELCGLLPPSQLIRSLGLPFHSRGVSLIRLALFQTLQFKPVLDAVLFLDGIRHEVADRWSSPPAKIIPPVPLADTMLRVREMYDQPLWETHPHVQVLEALVREVRRQGAHALVLIAPVPVPAKENPEEEAAYWERNTAVLQQAVDKADGELIDLHDFLDDKSFRDLGGHLNGKGHTLMHNRLAPRIHEILDLPPPARRGVPKEPANRRPRRIVPSR